MYVGLVEFMHVADVTDFLKRVREEKGSTCSFVVSILQFWKVSEMDFVWPTEIERGFEKCILRKVEVAILVLGRKLPKIDWLKNKRTYFCFFQRFVVDQNF